MSENSGVTKCFYQWDELGVQLYEINHMIASLLPSSITTTRQMSQNKRNHQAESQNQVSAIRVQKKIYTKTKDEGVLAITHISLAA